jgi:hypothetical protein
MEKGKFLTLPGLEPLPLDRPARSQAPYRLPYPGSNYAVKYFIKYKCLNKRSLRLVSIILINLAIFFIRDYVVYTARPGFTVIPLPSGYSAVVLAFLASIAKLKRCNSPGIGVKHYFLRSIKSLIIFGIRKNCLWSGRSLLLYKFRRATKLTGNYRGISLINFIHNSIKCLCLRIKSVYTQIYCGSSVWVST